MKEFKYLRRHLFTHEPKDNFQFQCKICEKKFSHGNILEKHIKRSHGSKTPIVKPDINCPICYIQYVKYVTIFYLKLREIFDFLLLFLLLFTITGSNQLVWNRICWEYMKKNLLQKHVTFAPKCFKVNPIYRNIWQSTWIESWPKFNAKFVENGLKIAIFFDHTTWLTKLKNQKNVHIVTRSNTAYERSDHILWLLIQNPSINVLTVINHSLDQLHSK